MERTVLVGGSIDWANCDGHRKALSTHEYGDGTIDPGGYLNLASFELDGMLPVWRFEIGEIVVERRVWMPLGRNMTWVSFGLVRGGRQVELDFTPLVTWRDFHTLMTTSEAPEVEAAGGGLAVGWGGNR